MAKWTAKNKSNARLMIPSTRRTATELSNTPAPTETQKAQMKSPVHAPRPIGQADQNPPPRSLGNKPRRIISALIGPGGHATDQPRM